MSAPDTNTRPVALLFEGRARLYLSEAARALAVSQQEIVALIQAGQLPAISVLNGIGCKEALELKVTPRNTWRVLTTGMVKILEERRR